MSFSYAIGHWNGHDAYEQSFEVLLREAESHPDSDLQGLAILHVREDARAAIALFQELLEDESESVRAHARNALNIIHSDLK